MKTKLDIGSAAALARWIYDRRRFLWLLDGRRWRNTFRRRRHRLLQRYYRIAPGGLADLCHRNFSPQVAGVIEQLETDRNQLAEKHLSSARAFILDAITNLSSRLAPSESAIAETLSCRAASRR